MWTRWGYPMPLRADRFFGLHLEVAAVSTADSSDSTTIKPSVGLVERSCKLQPEPWRNSHPSLEPASQRASGVPGNCRVCHPVADSRWDCGPPCLALGIITLI